MYKFDDFLQNLGVRTSQKIMFDMAKDVEMGALVMDDPEMPPGVSAADWYYYVTYHQPTIDALNTGKLLDESQAIVARGLGLDVFRAGEDASGKPLYSGPASPYTPPDGNFASPTPRTSTIDEGPPPAPPPSEGGGQGGAE